MGECFISRRGGAGGGQLYYDVVCQTAEPAKKEGRIWVKSSVAMTRFLFNDAPWSTAVVGTVMVTGSLGGANPSSTNSIIQVFNTKVSGIVNSMKVKPYRCQQVQGSAGNWVYVDAYVCHNNTWVQFSSAWNGELFDNGNQYEGVTGGWVGNNNTEIGATLKLKVANSRPIVSTQKAIDLTGFTKLHCIADMAFGKFGVTGIKDLTAGEPNWVASASIGTSDTVLDISSIQSGYIQCFAVASWAVTINVTKMWLT